MSAKTAEALGFDIAEIEDRIANNWSLPTRCYWDQDIFDFELDAIFAKRWQFFCPVQKVMKPGDVAVRQVGRYPVVVTCDRNGRLHGFLNICRHRGYTVAERDQSKCLRLVCRYHGWSYNLDGALAHAPDADGEAGFCKDDLSLRRVAVDQWGAAIFIHPDPQAACMRETYPALFETADEIAFDPDPAEWIPYKEVVYDIPTNWKLWYDNGTECYHCPNIHSASFGKAFNVKPEDTTIRLKENFSSYIFNAQPNDGSNRLTADNFKSFQLFPGYVAVEHDEFFHMTSMTPIGPGQTRHTAYYFGQKDVDPQRIDGWFKIWDDTYREDNEVTADQYENLKSGRQPYNRYVAGREYAAQHFHTMIWNDYKAELAT